MFVPGTRPVTTALQLVVPTAFVNSPVPESFCNRYSTRATPVLSVALPVIVTTALVCRELSAGPRNETVGGSTSSAGIPSWVTVNFFPAIWKVAVRVRVPGFGSKEYWSSPLPVCPGETRAIHGTFSETVQEQPEV